jgi:hypothetical protein
LADTKSLHLGCTLPQVNYPGPLFHAFPEWNAIVNPLHANDGNWDLSPKRDVGDYWDGSWWAPELFYRREGPIVPVAYQVAFLRRQNSPLVAAAVQWNAAEYTFKPPHEATFAVVAMTGPDAPRYGARDTMTALRGVAAPIMTGASLLSLEVMPRNGLGTSGRARFGIDAPPPLSAMHPGEFALSDPVLVSTVGQDAPSNLIGALQHMAGSTRLENPARIGLYWEVYGLAVGDTADVSLKILRIEDRNAAERLFLGSRRDSVVMGWREPRRGDARPASSSGVTISPRGVVLDLSGSESGEYVVEIAMTRGTVTARTRRAFSIARR